MTPSGDQATVSVFVAVDPPTAFDVFTTETDLWWKRGMRFRSAGRALGTVSFEPGIGGRLFETVELRDGSPRTYVMGRIVVWQPPSRLVVEWRNTNFAPDEHTELEVLFEPAERGTRVTVHHRGWSTLRPDHPARHGQTGPAFSRMMALWWGEMMTSFRERVATRNE